MKRKIESYSSPAVELVEFITEQVVLVNSPMVSEDGLGLTLKDLGDETQW